MSDMLTPTEAAERLGVSSATVRRWLTEGRLSGIQVGGRYRIHVLAQMLAKVDLNTGTVA